MLCLTICCYISATTPRQHAHRMRLFSRWPSLHVVPVHTHLSTHDFSHPRGVARLTRASAVAVRSLRPFYSADLSHTTHTFFPPPLVPIRTRLCISHTWSQKGLHASSISIIHSCVLEDQVSGVHLLCRLCTAHAPKRAVFASFVGQGRACLSTKWSPGSMKRLRA